MIFYPDSENNIVIYSIEQLACAVINIYSDI